MIEIDEFGNEIVTAINVGMFFGDALGARFMTDLPVPLKADAGLSDAAVGNRLSALIPLKLGKQADCDGKIVSVEK
jgi:hypothetical protein